MRRTLAGLLLAGLLIGGCSNGNHTTGAVKSEQKYTNRNQADLIKAQPPPLIPYSLERENLIWRYKVLSDPNKLQYLYIIGYTGQIIAHYTIRGKVSSVSSQITNPTQVLCRTFPGNAPDGCGSIDQAEPDGSYGTNGSGHFAKLTSGAYMEFEGPYIETDQPLILHSPVQATVNENVAPTATHNRVK